MLKQNILKKREAADAKKHQQKKFIDLDNIVPQTKKEDVFLDYFKKSENDNPTDHIKKNEPVDTKFLEDLIPLRPPVKQSYLKEELNDKLFMFSQVEKHLSKDPLLIKQVNAFIKKRKGIAT